MNVILFLIFLRQLLYRFFAALLMAADTYSCYYGGVDPLGVLLMALDCLARWLLG